MNALLAELRILRADGSVVAVVSIHADGEKVVRGNVTAAELLFPIVTAALLKKEGE